MVIMFGVSKSYPNITNLHILVNVFPLRISTDKYPSARNGINAIITNLVYIIK